MTPLPLRGAGETETPLVIEAVELTGDVAGAPPAQVEEEWWAEEAKASPSARDEPPAEVKVLRVKAGGWEETGDRPLTSEGEDDWWAPEDEGGSETDDIEA